MYHFTLLFLAALGGLQDLSSLTSNWTRVTAVKTPSPNHSTAKELPILASFFYWTIIAPQCCLSFCYTAKWISYTYALVCIYLNPLRCSPPIPPFQVITDHEAELPCYTTDSHSLAILHMVLCMCQSNSPSSSQPNFHFLPVSTCPFSIPASLFLPCR